MTLSKTRWLVVSLFMAVVSVIGVLPTLAQGITLSGTVIDEKSEKPVAGAKVELSNANAGTGYFVAHTGEDGRFAFTQVRAGLYYDLGVLANGYCPYEIQSWSVPENQSSADLKIPLVQGAAIRGKVTTSDGQTPLSNTRITLTYESGDFQMLESEQSLFTDAEGQFQFGQIPPNQYRLSIGRGGYINEEIVGIRPQPGDEKNFNVKLYKPGNISGTVLLDENGSPLPNIEIGARGASQRVGTTDENGFFTIGSLKPGAYKLQTHPGGFNKYEAGKTIQIAEGESQSGVEIRLKPLPPALSVSVQREVFLPDQDLVFQVRTFRIGQYQCDIHAIPANRFLSEQSNVRELTEKGDLAPFAVALHWTEEVNFTNPYVWIDENLKAPEKMKPGAYVLRIFSPGDKIEHRVLFFVTQLGIIVKRGEKKTFVYATDLQTNMPIKDANVRVVSHNPERKKNRPGWTETLRNEPQEAVKFDGQTNEQGIFLLEHAYPAPSADVIAISPDGFLAVSQINQSDLIHAQSNTIFAYTDRPVYRPGHTVFYKAIFRQKNEDRSYAIPANETVTITVKDPEEEEFFSTELTTNEWGSVNGSFEIPGDAPLGEYRIFAKSASAVENSIHFYVEEYRKPEYKVEIEPEKDFYINGETLAFSVRAEYYFGAPVPNADVRYRIYESYAAGGESHDYPSSYSSFLTSGETRTDAEGMARIEFAPERSSRDRRISLEVDVVEASGRQVSSSAGVPVGVGSYYLTAKPARFVFDRETPLRVDIQSRTHNDKVISASVEVEFIQEVWNPVRKRYERPSRPQATRAGITDEKGNLSIEWLPDSDISGRIDVTVNSIDPAGNRIGATTKLWRMAFQAGSFDLQYPTLEGILDKESYKPGEEATLLINTNYPENPVIVTVEGRDILLHRVVWPAGKTTAIRIPVLPEYAPNVYVSLFMPRGINLSTRTYDLNIPERRGDLVVEVKADREKYKPGETGTIEVKTSLPDGSPIASEVSLAVVDEAIFAIRADHTSNIHKAFYDRQSNWVLTSFSYPMKYYGGANKGVFPDLRKNFRDTALWVANLYTDANGLGSATVKFPDNLTTWRLTARGHTKNTDVGWVKGKTMVTKDIVARFSIPRFFTEGDKVQIPAMVNNLSNADLSNIQTRLSVMGGVELKGATEKVTQAAAGAVARDTWDVTVNGASPEAVFTFEARSPQDSDALQIPAPVLPLGYRFNQFQTGKFAEAKAGISLTIDDNILLNSSKVTLSLTPSLAAVALGAIPYLTDFPYGCVEQTLNGFLPNLLLRKTLEDLGASPEQDEKAAVDLIDKVNRSLDRLYAMQKYDGAWGWFTNSNSDLLLTALVVHGLYQTQQLEYSIDEDRLKNGIEYLKNALSGARVWDSQAYVTYVLSDVLPGEEPPLLNELHANRNELSDFGLAVSALAFHNRQKDKEANEILDLLMTRLANLSDRHAAWQVSPERMWTWNGSASETTAWGLKALVALRGMVPEADKIVQWLIGQRWGDHWHSTRETAAVVDALRSAIQAQTQTGDLEPLEYQVLINDKQVNEGVIAKENMIRSTPIPIKPGKGANAIQVVLNRVQGYWSLDASLFRHGEIAKPAGHAEFQLTRLFERAIHTRDYRGRPKILTEGFSPDDAQKVGQEILVTLVIQAKRDLPYMIVEDPLPSGCEIIESFLKQDEYGWAPYSHFERRDQKMVFFLDNVPKGETRIEYLMRAEVQGVFRANPAHAWCMYYPDISAHSAGNRVTVK